MGKKGRKIPPLVKRLITRNGLKRLRSWPVPAPGWNVRRIILEVAGRGAWFTLTAVRKEFPFLLRYQISPHLLALWRRGLLERQAIDGRGVTTLGEHNATAQLARSIPRMTVKRPRARWAYRVTHAGLDELEGLRAGKRDVLGCRRSEAYRILAEWMPGRGPVHHRAIMARLGPGTWRGVTHWLRWNYGTPWPVEGRRGWWEWRAASWEELSE